MRIRTVLLSVAALGLAACASSGLVSSWKAPDATPLQVSGAKVAAVVMMKEQSSRRAAEDALVRELNARGAHGVAMYTLMPEATPGDEAAVRAELEKQGFAGMVTMRPVAREKEVVSSPATFYTQPYYGGLWGGYYGYGWGSPWSYTVVSPGDVRTNTIVTVETLVYSLRQNKLVWAGESKTTNPRTVDRLIQDTAKQAAAELGRQGLLSK